MAATCSTACRCAARRAAVHSSSCACARARKHAHAHTHFDERGMIASIRACTDTQKRTCVYACMLACVCARAACAYTSRRTTVHLAHGDACRSAIVGEAIGEGRSSSAATSHAAAERRSPLAGLSGDSASANGGTAAVEAVAVKSAKPFCQTTICYHN